MTELRSCFLHGDYVGDDCPGCKRVRKLRSAGGAAKAKVEVGIDWSRGSDIAVIRCYCGFSADTLDEMIPHLRGHGVTAVTLKVEEPRRKR